jgi:site-specific recombinase XerD
MPEAFITASPLVLAESPQHVTTIRSTPGSVFITQETSLDLLAMPKQLAEIPGWLYEPMRRFLRLKQRNWPAKTVQRSTRQLFNRLNHMVTFFIKQHEWSEWNQLAPHWIEDYIDTKLREGKAPTTINWDLYNLRVFCRFLIDEGFNVSGAILRMKFLDTPRRLPRPLSGEQVLFLEKSIQNAVSEAKNDRKLVLAVRDLICFYLLWHCGLRISEVCSLLITDLDITARKILIRNSKERKDRIVYISDSVALSLQQYLAIREDHDAIPLFLTKGGGIMTTRTLQRRLTHYGEQCKVPVTAHRLRHTFASQMLTAGMPVTSLQRYLGHEHLDTTMIYAEVSDPLLQQDYYQGIIALDPSSACLPTHHMDLSHKDTLRQLVEELKTARVNPIRRDEILSQMQHLLKDDHQNISE